MRYIEAVRLPDLQAAGVLQLRMNTVDIEEIQSDFAGYLRNAKAGETFLVTQYGQPIAEIKPLAPVEEGAARQLRPFGLAKGEFVVPDDFNDPLPEEILRDFEGRGRSWEG